MQYKFYFYAGTSTAEHKPKVELGDGVIIETVVIASDDDALLYAGDYISDMNGHQAEFESGVEAEDYLNDIDSTSGDAFCIAIEKDDQFIYGDSELVDYFMSSQADDDAITEDIMDNSKVIAVTDIENSINELEAEIKSIERDMRPLNWSDEVRNHDVALSYLSDDERASVKQLTSKIKDLKKEIYDLASQYKTVKYTKTYGGQYGEIEDIESEVIIHDQGAMRRLLPTVHKLKQEVKKLEPELHILLGKAKDAYNSDLGVRKSTMGYNDKRNRLSTLKASKAALLREISEDPSFNEIVTYINKESKTVYKTQDANVTTVSAKIVEGKPCLLLKFSAKISLDFDDFDEENGELLEDRLSADLETYLGEAFYFDVDDPFECDNSNDKFIINVDDISITGDAEMHWSYDPGDRYNPPETDAWIDGTTSVSATVKITKIS